VRAVHFLRPDELQRHMRVVRIRLAVFKAWFGENRIEKVGKTRRPHFTDARVSVVESRVGLT
jgi:hypothetical protein